MTVSTIGLDRRKGDRERVVILGSGWSGFTLSRNLDKKKFQTVVVSPRSYFVFTPLLASTAVGTIEFRTAIESVRGRAAGVEFFQGWADDVDFARKTITIEENATESQSTAPLPADPGHAEERRRKGKTFELQYDKLVVAVGCYSQTFGTPGVKKNALFLKDVGDARKIRKRILDCFEKASLPTTPESLRQQLLNFAIVGGGPTGVEFAAELYDLCNDDLQRLYPSLIGKVRISIYDVAPSILSMFDKNLATYAMEHFKRDRVNILTSSNILGLRKGLPGIPEDAEDPVGFTLKTKEHGEVGVGMCVWSTGLMMNPFIQKALNDVHVYPSASIARNTGRGNSNGNGNGRSTHESNSSATPSSIKWRLDRDPKSGALMTDAQMRVQLVASSPSSSQTSSNSGTTSASSPSAAATSTSKPSASRPRSATMADVFALGDVARPVTGALPATAQVAAQEAVWLAKRLNKGDLEGQRFAFRNLGIMTYLGGWKAIMQAPSLRKEGASNEITGWAAWVIWRGAYLTKTISWRNKLLIPIYWVINWIFGRDISRF